MTLMVFATLQTAHADVVRGPPGCPDGAVGAASYSGSWCAPARCYDATQCSEGTCQNVGLCVASGEVPCGGRRRSPEP